MSYFFLERLLPVAQYAEAEENRVIRQHGRPRDDARCGVRPEISHHEKLRDKRQRHEPQQSQRRGDKPIRNRFPVQLARHPCHHSETGDQPDEVVEKPEVREDIGIIASSQLTAATMATTCAQPGS